MKTYLLSVYWKRWKTLSLSAIIMMNSCFVSQALADETLNRSASIDIYANWVRATDDELAQLRGGFMLPNGMIINFSLEKIVFLNDIEIFSSLVKFPEEGFLLQHGNQNFAENLAGSALGTVIQNSLDDQVIKAINEINIEIGNLQNLELNNNHGGIDFILPNLR